MNIPPLMQIEQIDSPHQSSRQGYQPQLIVCHITEGSYPAAKSWFLNPLSQTSSHFIVGARGQICQCVPLDRMAWCNGTTTAQQDKRYFGHSPLALVKKLGENANLYSVSIECEGQVAQTGGALTEEQFAALCWLVRHIQKEVAAQFSHTIPTDRAHIVGHYQITPLTRPLCPGPRFPWTKLLQVLQPEDMPILKDCSVTFAGGQVYLSSLSKSANSTLPPSLCKVTAVAAGTPHPYHCVSQDGKGVYGWVNAADVKRLPEPTTS